MFESQAKAIKNRLPSFSFLRGQEFCNWYLDKHDLSTPNEVTADTAHMGIFESVTSSFPQLFVQGLGTRLVNGQI